MSKSRWSDLFSGASDEFTPDERASGWHFCPEWDGAPIGPGMRESTACYCFSAGDPRRTILDRYKPEEEEDAS